MMTTKTTENNSPPLSVPSSSLVKKTPKKVGRPTKLQGDTLAKLEEIFKKGATIEEACAYAQIDQSNYHRRASRDPEFARKMNAARYYATIVAKNVIVESIEAKNLESAKYWLDRNVYRPNQVQLNQQFNTSSLGVAFVQYAPDQTSQTPIRGCNESDTV